ncbi:MAG: dihydrolipoyl dehydrogenase [Candidatus Krumholzibacteria bacterium]|nr:dihydrolipoyl dehydrogenase [Candidatus Krumholzibacteria bacterium]MDH4337801.1 dihydrolipoyl dehydrogenase [Candidatus Krumholzibacteria bacterium]MDH5271161.1 dihydrolipoyl dehydrogenase [Candidatus Krumholzibacteria bacterium]MDH5626884.1 dihydrolipoyl dehydrogenase [Candidatus Krumholzibacteria bacterium]
MAADSFQLVVLGGGPGGYAAAFLGADLGLKTALVDLDENPGGVCLYRGCIPSKALLHVAKLLHEASAAKAMGVDFGEPKVDLDALRSWKDGVVRKLTGGVGTLAKSRKVEFVQGRGRFENAHTMSVELATGGARTLSFEHAIVATGSLPVTLPMFDAASPRVLDSTSALALERVPASMLVVGGGYIGLELGSVYAALGTKVSVVEMLSGLVPGADRDLVNVLEKSAGKNFKRIMLETKVTAAREDGEGVHVTFEGRTSETARYDSVLVAVGRRPNARDIGLENTRVGVSERGFVEVDVQRRSAEPSIFAIGDVVGEPMLAHKASHEGRVAAEVIAGHKVAFEPNAIPAVMFTDPEIAWCGLTEAQAKEKGVEVEVAKFPWAASGRAMTLERTDGLTKLIVDPKTGRLLGVGIAGAGAGDLIAEGALAIEMGALVSDVKLTIHPHPTLSETVMEAAEVFFGQSTHVYRPKRKR